MGDDIEDDVSHLNPVGRSSVFYYGVGHMLNDITAACWFTYLLLFLTDIGLSPRYISLSLLISNPHALLSIYFLSLLYIRAHSDRLMFFSIYFAEMLLQ